MENADKKFDVSIFSENKGKDKFTFTFDFKITSDSNCRIKIFSCQVYDLDGNMYQAQDNNISSTDIIIGISKYFSDSKKINVYISKLYKSRIGCSLVLTIADLDLKQKFRLCYQKKSATRWDVVGVEMLEYEDIISEADEKTAGAEHALATELINETNQHDVEDNGSEEVINNQQEDATSTETEEDEAVTVETENHSEAQNNESDDKEDMTSEDSDQEDDVETEIKTEDVSNVASHLDSNTNSASEEVVTDDLEEVDIEEEQVEEEMSGIDQYLNSILEYDIASATKIGLVLDQVRLSAVDNGKNYEVSLSCMPSPSQERRLMVRCPMIKAFFYDARGSIDNVAMARMSMMSDIDEEIGIFLKKAPLKYWENLSKIKIMATV